MEAAPSPAGVPLQQQGLAGNAPTIAPTQAATTVLPTATTAPAAPKLAPIPIDPVSLSVAPDWAKHVIDGTRLVIAATDHPKWSLQAGKTAIVLTSAPGDAPGAVLFTIEIDGLVYPDVNANRFVPPAVVAPVPPAPPASTGIPESVAKFAADQQYRTILAEMTTQQRAAVLKGQVVTVTVLSTLSAINCMLENVTEQGIIILGGKLTPWADIKSIEPMGAIPGAPPTPEQKAAAKAAAKAEKAAAKVAAKNLNAVTTLDGAASDGRNVQPAQLTDAELTKAMIPPATAIAQALDAINVALTGGKVTRKVLEAIVPLLTVAQQYQNELAAGAPAAPTGAPKPPPLFTPEEILTALEGAKQAADKAYDMAVKALVF